MANDIQYPTKEKVIEYNLLALTLIKVKKADQPKVLSNHANQGVDKKWQNTRIQEIRKNMKLWLKS